MCLKMWIGGFIGRCWSKLGKERSDFHKILQFAKNSENPTAFLSTSPKSLLPLFRADLMFRFKVLAKGGGGMKADLVGDFFNVELGAF